MLSSFMFSRSPVRYYFFVQLFSLFLTTIRFGVTGRKKPSITRFPQNVMLRMNANTTAYNPFSRNGLINDELHQCRMFQRRVSNFRSRYFGISKQPKIPEETVYYNSARFPNMCVNKYFYDDIMNIIDRHIEKYRKCAPTIYNIFMVITTVSRWSFY